MFRIIVPLVLLSALLAGSCNNQTNTKPVATQQSAIKQSVEILTNVLASEDDIPMLIGTYTRKEGHVNGHAKGIHLAYLNPENGHLRLAGTYEAGINPSYLTIRPDGKYIYAVNETGGRDDEQWGSITALEVNEDKSLTIINSKSTEGIAPCHVSFNKQGTHLLVANYSTGSITSFATGIDGRLASAQTVIRYKGKGKTARQERPHAHFIHEIKHGEIVTADLGTDTIRFHSFEGTQLHEANKYVTTPPGSGPRHMTFHPLESIMYVVNELSATITSYKANADGQYQTYQSISTLPEGDQGAGSCAAIKMTSNGKYLYASNRGDYNNIAIYKVDRAGKLEMVSHQSTLGNVPRDIEISPDNQYVIAANQNSDNLVSFKIDQETGLLKNPKILEGVATPVCVKFF